MKISTVKELAVIIKSKRKSLKMTQAECAALCGVGTRFFSELENGKETLQLKKILVVLHMMGIELEATEK